ncbi:hypothetical protein BJY01DRAFT_240624 [Aspergillus pseudoustus]|uniref:Zn(2)-C6 fungal-type domain-containing protein n=1 Tax=Aspergillus pseudoustus TaxID=1810923 RepID=A0ABR4IPC4_9EURO
MSEDPTLQLHHSLPLQSRPGTKRRRVNVACNTCRGHKIRCDGVRPDCGTCCRRREKCVYSDESDGKISSSARHRINNEMEITNPSADPRLDQPAPLDHQSDPEVTAMGLATRQLSDLYDTEDSLKEFFGDSSAVAFIKRLQEALKSGTPAPGLPQSPYSNTSQDASRRLRTKRDAECFRIPLNLLPPRALADHLVDCYFSRIHTLYPFVHKQAFLSCYELVWEPRAGKLDTAANTYLSAGLGLGDIAVSTTTFYYGLNIVFAMGCQFSDLVHAERGTTSEAFFHRCKRALDVEYLERGDFALVQIILLMAHYLQGSQTPNRCWHAIGTACRLAQGVGLHTVRGDEHRSFAQRQMRRRVWHGCRMLDLAISSMLGRPPMTTSSPSVPLPDAVDDCYLSGTAMEGSQPVGSFSRVEWFVSTVKLHDLLREINDMLYDDAMGNLTNTSTDQKKTDKVRQIQHITQIDSRLEDFRRSLPQQLRWEDAIPTNQSDIFLREKYLLKARFLLLRLLAYRPVLSQSLGQIRNAKVGGNEQMHTTSLAESGIYSNFTQNCSVLCVQAAIDLISLVFQTCNTDLASVWFYSVFYAFTAGLVLILAEFDNHVVGAVTREALDLAWDNCSSALDYLKMYSAVAEKCANGLIGTRSKCLKLAAGKKYLMPGHTRLMNIDRNHEPRTALEVQNSSTLDSAALDSAGDAPYFGDLFNDLNLDNISHDWSWFDIGY